MLSFKLYSLYQMWSLHFTLQESQPQREEGNRQSSVKSLWHSFNILSLVITTFASTQKQRLNKSKICNYKTVEKEKIENENRKTRFMCREYLINSKWCSVNLQNARVIVIFSNIDFSILLSNAWKTSPILEPWKNGLKIKI